MQLVFVKNQQLNFFDEHAFFYVLGFLSRSENETSLVWENNKECGAWENESRIHIFGNKNKLPEPLKSAVTKGVGNITCRINCNEYFNYLVSNFQLHERKHQYIENIEAILHSKHPLYIDDFKKGLMHSITP